MDAEQKAEWGRKEFEQRLADIAAVKAGTMTLADAQKAARSRSRQSGMNGNDAYHAMRDSHR